MSKKWILAGYVHVESGNVMINDIPESEIDQALSKYYKALSVVEPGQTIEMDSYVESSDGMGVILNGFGGDGSYPIYLQEDDDGLTIEARIIFNGPPPQGEEVQ